MWADAHAARCCRLRRPASQAFQSCSRLEYASDSDALRAEGASALSAVFPNQFGVHPMKHNLGAKPVKEVTIYLIDII